ncbi:MAG: ipoprotein LpqH [Mycobacterium sp.]|jgi:lipoprotein LpqH|nr:ipoprotein LpqH [Mycobacterium sp.]
MLTCCDNLRCIAGVTVAAIAIAGLTGCSSDKSGAPAAGSSPAPGTAGAVGDRVLLDGQDQGAVQHVLCSNFAGGYRIKMSMGDHGVVAILSSAVPPAALGVQISNTAANGGVFEFDSTKNEGSGEVTKQDNFYKITGTAVSKSSSGDAGKPFEVDVTCTT